MGKKVKKGEVLMKRLVSVIAIVCIAMTSVIIVTEANVIQVPKEHKTIQAALKIAKKGDTVFVAEGEYREVVALEDGVKLQGAGEKSVLRATIKALNVTDAVVAGFAMKGGTKNDHFGIFCRNAKVTIKDMTIWGFHHAISAEASRITLKNNIITNSFNVGIFVTTYSEALIEENQVVENQGAGMIISNSDKKILVSNNTIKKNHTAGIECHDASPIIRHNLITQNTFGISIDNAQPHLGTTSDPGLNIIYGNKGGDVVNSGKDVVYAQQNYWGKSDGPCADCIVGRVEYKPWLRQESPDEKQAVSTRAKFFVIWGWLKKIASDSLP